MVATHKWHQLIDNTVALGGSGRSESFENADEKRRTVHPGSLNRRTQGGASFDVGNFNHRVRSRRILTGLPFRAHVTVGAGFEAPDVQFTRRVSPAGKRSLSDSIEGSISGTSSNYIIYNR